MAPNFTIVILWCVTLNLALSLNTILHIVLSDMFINLNMYLLFALNIALWALTEWKAKWLRDPYAIASKFCLLMSAVYAGLIQTTNLFTVDFILWYGLFLPALFGLVLWYYRAYRRDIIGLSLSYLILVALINIYCVKFAVDPDSLNLFGVLFGLAIIDFILLIFILTKLNHWFKQQSLSLSVEFYLFALLLLLACYLSRARVNIFI